jgi:hypothetical protein
MFAAGMVQASDDKDSAAKGDPRAAALMHEAMKTRYSWSPEITAVTGKVSWELNGQAGTANFRDQLHQRNGLTFTPDNSAQVPTEVKEHVGSMISHRSPPNPKSAKRAPAPQVIVVEDDERGPLIMTVGDPMQSTQRVKDRKLVQVNRTMGGQRFTIDVSDFEESPDGRFFASTWTVTYWDAASGKRVEKQTHTTQGFQSVDGQMFPKAEKLVTEKDGKTTTLDLRYSDVKFESGRPQPETK